MGLAGFNRARRLQKERESSGNKTEKVNESGHEAEKKQEEVRNGGESGQTEYEEMTIKELKELAESKGLTGYSKLKKDELIALIGGE